MRDFHYSMIIQWDEEDHIFVVTVPELPGCMTHGKTCEEAIQQGKEAIEGWIEVAEGLGWPVPAPLVTAWQSFFGKKSVTTKKKSDILMEQNTVLMCLYM